MHSELAGVEYNHKKHVRLVTPDGMAERGRRVGGINRNVESYAYKAAGIHERKLSCLCCGCFHRGKNVHLHPVSAVKMAMFRFSVTT